MRWAAYFLKEINKLEMSMSNLRSEILPAAFESPGTRIVGCEFDTEFEAVDQFASSVLFVIVTVERNNGTVKIPVVIKTEPLKVSTRKFSNTSTQFYNEVFMYSKVLPFFKNDKLLNEIFPTFYYGVGSIEEPNKNVVIVEDLRPLGYRLTKNKAFLDFEHLSLALSKLGKFHALSYAAKETSGEKLLKVVSSLRENFCRRENKIALLARAGLHRAIDPLVNQGKHVDLLKRFLHLVDSVDGFLDFLHKVSSPNDPLAVVCHGDFLRNNMIFKYVNDRPTDVKFFDIATSRFASPAIDISLLLFLNSSKELRDSHWNDLLEIYHSSLSSTIPGTKVPSLEEIKEAMREKAVWGFVHCVYFLPTMLFNCPLNIGELSVMSTENMISVILSHGGETGTKVLNDLVEELIQKHCLSVEHSFM